MGNTNTIEGKGFVKKLVGFSLSTWISFIISFISAPIATRLFFPAELGKINIFLTYANFLGIFVLLGLDQAFARFYHEPPCHKNQKYLFTFCVSITYALLFTFVLTAFVFGTSLSHLLFQEQDNLLLILFLISVFTTSTLRYLNLSYRMQQNTRMFTIQGILITIVTKISYIFACFWDPTYKFALLLMIISQVILCLFFVIRQRKLFEFPIKYEKRFSTEMLAYALPLVPTSVLVWANTAIPPLMMQKYMNYESIGIYTSAVSIAGIIHIVQAGFNIFWVPFAFQHYKTQTTQFFKVHKMVVCCLALLGLSLVCFQDVVFQLLGDKYRGAKEFFPFLLLPPICYTIGETAGLGIEISKKTYFGLIIFGLSVLSNFVLCYFLIQTMGVPGVAIATACSAIIAMFAKAFIGERFYKVVENYFYMISSVVLILASAVITLMVKDNILLKYLLLGGTLMTACILYYKQINALIKLSWSFIHDLKK